MHQDELLIIYLAKNNDDEAIELLMNRYKHTHLLL